MDREQEILNILKKLTDTILASQKIQQGVISTMNLMKGRIVSLENDIKRLEEVYQQ